VIHVTIRENYYTKLGEFCRSFSLNEIITFFDALLKDHLAYSYTIYLLVNYHHHDATLSNFYFIDVFDNIFDDFNLRERQIPS
jgi:hypothetical protein